MVSIKGISLKNIKQGYGPEGNGLEASIYLDGRHVASIKNNGNGGNNRYHWGIRKSNKWVNLPEVRKTIVSRIRDYFTEIGKEELFESLDAFFDAILELQRIKDAAESD